jgi:hypothetical protein
MTNDVIVNQAGFIGQRSKCKWSLSSDGGGILIFADLVALVT